MGLSPHTCSPSVCRCLPFVLPAPPTRPPWPLCPAPRFPQSGLAHTFALSHTGRAIKVSAGVSRAAGAEVLTEVRLIGAHGAADAAVDAGVVVVPRGALDCRQWGKRQESGWQAEFLLGVPTFSQSCQNLNSKGKKQTLQSGWLQCQSLSSRR